MSIDLLKKGFMTSNMLKLLAIVSMLIDHVGLMLLDNYYPMRVIGRLAMPIFAFLIAEGCTYTKNKCRHFFEIFLLGAFCQTVSFIGGRTKLNILLSFSVSILLIYVTQYAMKNKKFIPLPFIFLGILYIVVRRFLPQVGVTFEYGFYGMLIPWFAFIPKNKWLKIISFTLGLLLLCRISYRMQLYSLFALIPVIFYNGERGKFKFKYAFYIFYPLHLFVIYAIKDIIERLT